MGTDGSALLKNEGRPESPFVVSQTIFGRAGALHLHQRHLGDGAAAARRCALGAGGLRTPRRAGPALGLGRDLLRLRRDRPVEELEAELVASSLVRGDDDTDVSAALELAEQNLV